MNRRTFLLASLAGKVVPPLQAKLDPPLTGEGTAPGGSPDDGKPRVAVLVVDTDRVTTPIDARIYGHFLEHINHSVEDGLFAEQIRGSGFEGDDFKTYWQPIAERGSVEIVQTSFRNGNKSVRLSVEGGGAAVQQGRLFVDQGVTYSGSLWAKREKGQPQLALRIRTSQGQEVGSLPLALSGSDWLEIPFSFTSPLRDTQAVLEVLATGHGTVLIDFVSLMRADLRSEAALRPDLLQALRDLHPTFIRWPGGSFASTYRWNEGIGQYSARGYHPNTFWGGYSDYYGFGTDEFLALCRKLNAEPLIVLPAPGTDRDQVAYAMDWVRYLNDPPTTRWGQLRASNGHAEPYGIRFFQIDNEPMNNGFTPEKYAEIVNVYGRQLRALAPHSRIVACGQKRSADLDWSKKIIDLAGANFDILGCHNYEYEPDDFATGLRRIHDYLGELREYVRISQHSGIELAVLEWSLQHTYDWRAGLHTAGSLIMYEQLSPALTMSCPALLMRNTTDDPTWTSFIYHDHVSWFPGAGYVVEKLFREHYAEQYLASTSGTFRDLPDRQLFFRQISTAKPEDWRPDTVDGIATCSADGRRIVIKAVNYTAQPSTLLVQLRGERAPQHASANLYTITAKLNQVASMQHPDAIMPVTRPFPYAKDLAIDLAPYTVAVLEVQA